MRARDASPSSLVRAVVVIIGEAREVVAEPDRWSVLRLEPGDSLPPPVAAVLVLDLRALSPSDLSAVRSGPPFSSMPCLLVADAPVPEAVFTLLDADDTIVLGSAGTGDTIERDMLKRRLTMLCELAALRRSVSFAHVAELMEAQAEIDALCLTLAHPQRFDHAILDGLDVGIATADDAGQITFINRCAAHLLELGQDVTGFAARDVLGLAQEPRDLLAGQARCTVGYPLATSEGTELDLEMSISRGDEWVDDRVGFFFIFRDVREEKHRDSERARFQRLVAMGTMVAGFAHEVRNPVAALRSLAEELAEELRDAGLGFPHVGLMLQMVERIERLVRTSLQFGRPAAPKRAPQRPSVIVKSALTELRPRLRALGGDIVLEIEPDLPDVDVDEKQVAQALVILLNNALDATGQPSRVVARVRRTAAPQDPRQRKSEPPLTTPTAVRFEIIDDGAGIPQDILERIFDPFFTTKPAGTGLGLSIAQQIISENGARLEVSSVPGVAGGAGRTSFSVIV